VRGGGDVELVALLDGVEAFDDGVWFGAGLLRVRSDVDLLVSRQSRVTIKRSVKTKMLV
jgi:hypothetical protein